MTDTRWIRVASHAVSWKCWRIARASVGGETVYTLFYVDGSGGIHARGVFRDDLDAAKRAAETFDAALPIPTPTPATE